MNGVMAMVKVKEDMTGWKMWEHGIPESRLTVIEQAEDYVNPNTKKHHARWLCFCNCGNLEPIITLGSNLKNGNTTSCGCLHREYLIKNNQTLKKKYNKYDLSGEYGVGWTSNTNKEFYFDLEDYDLIKDYCWREVTMNNGKYHALVSRDKITKQDIIMAWLIKGKHYDHIDRNPLNNKKENLRVATSQQNSQNRTLYSNNTSNIMGVSFEADRNQWRAQLRKDGKHKLNERFNTKEDAIRARLQAEAKYCGEFAPQKHLFEQYDIKFIPKEGERNG
jgi:phosphate-selective porin